MSDPARKVPVNIPGRTHDDFPEAIELNLKRKILEAFIIAKLSPSHVPTLAMPKPTGKLNKAEQALLDSLKPGEDLAFMQSAFDQAEELK
jgi:hypothetical protein